MPTTTIVLQPTQFQPGDRTSPAITIPAGPTGIEVTAILSDSDILTPGLLMTIYIESFVDGAWIERAHANWESGPHNTPRIPGDPIPRPGSGLLAVHEGETDWRGRLVNSARVRVGAQITTYP